MKINGLTKLQSMRFEALVEKNRLCREKMRVFSCYSCKKHKKCTNLSATVELEKKIK